MASRHCDKTFSVGARRLKEDISTAGVECEWVLVLELDRMNGVDNKERNDLGGTGTGLVYVCQLCLPLWFLFCIGAAELVLSIEGPLAIFCISNLLAGSEELKP